MKQEYKIQNYADRERLIIGFASSGYGVFVEERQGEWPWEHNYFVIVEVPDVH